MLRDNRVVACRKYASLLCDDTAGLILSKLDKTQDRKSFSEVCKDWLRLESQGRSSLRVIYETVPCLFSFSALSRFPNLVHLEFLYYHYSLITFDATRLFALENACPKLCRVKIRGPIGDSGVVAILHAAHNLTALAFVRNWAISDKSLRDIASTCSLSSLELKECSGITDVGLGYLANGSVSKTIKKLVLQECELITDTGYRQLNKMCYLEHLDLSSSRCIPGVHDIGRMDIFRIQTLKSLALKYLAGVSDTTMIALAENCHNLEVLDVNCCEKVTGAGIRAFSGHKCLKRLVLEDWYGFRRRSDWQSVELGCPSLESLVVVESDHIYPNCRRVKYRREWRAGLMHENPKVRIDYL